MSAMVFIDTSVLLNFFDVPNKNADRVSIKEEFAARQAKGQTFVLPVTSIIETGNHIAQLPGDARRRCAKALVNALELAIKDDNPPWVLTRGVWDATMLRAMISGTTGRVSALELLTQGIGTGDLGILAEMDALRGRIPRATPVEVWTLDTLLASWA